MSITREPVAATPRRPMTRARRTRIWIRDGGKCGKCSVAVPCRGTTIDHRLALHHGGPDTDENCWFLCEACDKPKTANDQSVSGHIRRLQKNEDPVLRRKGKREIRSAGFNTRLIKSVNGKVRLRKGVA